MELRVSENGEKFENVFIPADVTLSASGEGYFWVLGAEFGVRAEVVPGGCGSPVCPETVPVWHIQVVERTMNGPEGEFVPTDVEMRGHLDPATPVAGIVADLLYQLSSDPLVQVVAYMAPGSQVVRFGAWAAGVASELYVREGTEAFASLVLDEV